MTAPRKPGDRSGGPWRPPTRRAFVAALGAAAAALAIRNRDVLTRDDDDDRPPNRYAGTTRWIGHC
jgi:hypothetical protein